MNCKTEWFESWFDTKYYHTLYKDRDYAEAKLFIDNITNYLNLPDNAKVLDLACGRGRHSIYLNELNYNTVGVDLSGNSIKYAQQHENETLKFYTHDMREPMKEKFDAIFNLFTSFGYFDKEEDNLKTLINIKNSLTEYGFAVMDFMNVNKVIPNLVNNESKVVDGVEFNIHRWFENGFIYKNIKFSDDGQNYDYTEKLKALNIDDFQKLMEEAGIYLLETFGDYKLNKFYKNESDRLIMIFK